MLRIDFTKADLEVIEYDRLHHPHPRVQQKMWALWFKSHDLPHHTICELAGISENTLRTYMNDFLEGGINKLKELTFYKPKFILDDHRETLEEYFRENPPMSAAQAIEDIYRLTGIKRGLTQTREYLHRLGLNFRKVGSVPAKADPELQDVFKKNSLSPNSMRPNKTNELSIS